jgi:hypothetical protein
VLLCGIVGVGGCSAAAVRVVVAGRGDGRAAAAVVLCSGSVSFAGAARLLGADRGSVSRWVGPRPTVGRPERADVLDGEVVRLREVEGFSWRGIEAVTGMVQSGVRKRYARAKRAAAGAAGAVS